ncbi:FHA domain-containing protein [bacterium]|nr:FHA domain-containing protein [bacterium]
MRTLAFAEFALDTHCRSRDEFLAQTSTPCLLVEPSGDLSLAQADGKTPPLPNWWRPTPAPGRSRSFTLTGGIGAGAVAWAMSRAFVVWIEKSQRNPFENLITVGRAPNNDIVFALESISKLHATFNATGGRWFVQDHASTNGTFVNGERIGPANLRALNDGDCIQIAPELKTRFFTPAGLFDFLAILSHSGGIPEPGRSG